MHRECDRVILAMLLSFCILSGQNRTDVGSVQLYWLNLG